MQTIGDGRGVVEVEVKWRKFKNEKHGNKTTNQNKYENAMSVMDVSEQMDHWTWTAAFDFRKSTFKT